MLGSGVFKISRPRKNGLEVRMQVVGAIDRNLSISGFDSAYTYIKEVRRETFFCMNKLKKRQLNPLKKDSLAKAQELIDRTAGNLKGWNEAMLQANKQERHFLSNLATHLDVLLRSKEVQASELPKQPSDLSTFHLTPAVKDFGRVFNFTGSRTASLANAISPKRSALANPAVPSFNCNRRLTKSPSTPSSCCSPHSSSHSCSATTSSCIRCANPQGRDAPDSPCAPSIRSADSTMRSASTMPMSTF